MDENEDTLNRISRQLSEMGPVPHVDMSTDGSTPSDLMGDQWTHFSRMSVPSASPLPFHNLYTWNPLDCKPVSQPQGYPQDRSEFRNFGQSSNTWSRRSHHFTVPQMSQQNTGNQPGFEHPSMSYQISGQSFHGQNVSPVVPPCDSASNDYFRGSNVSSKLPDLLHRNPQRAAMFSHTCGDDTVFIPEELPPDHLAHTRSPPIFNPSTPPPMFLAQRQHLDNSAPPKSLSGLQPGETIFPQSQLAKSKLNIDLGTNIGSPSTSFADMDDKCLDSEEGRMLYKAAMDKWESGESNFNSNNSEETNGHSQSGKPQDASVVDRSKPSYSDIAKTPKSASQPAAGKPVNDEIVKNSAVPRQQKRDIKPFRAPLKRTSSGSKFLTRDSPDSSKSPSTSRYGLDDFGEHTPRSLNSSSESLSHITKSRRDSGSSVGSSVTALDDLTYSANCPSSSLETGTVKGKSADQKVNSSCAGKFSKPLKPSEAASKPTSAGKEHVFFDPKRIFQPRSSSKSQASAVASPKLKSNPGSTYEPCVASGLANSTLLNNGKPTAGGVSCKLPSSAKQHDYINNDLRDTSKQTNKTAEENAQSGVNSNDGPKYEKEYRPGKRSGNRVNGAAKKDKRRQGESAQKQFEGENGPHHQQDRPSLLLENLNTGVLEEWLALLWEKLSRWGNIFIIWLLNFLIYGLGLVLFLASSAVHLLLLMLSKCWTLSRSKLFKGRFASKESGRWSGREHLRRRVGMEENIVLPATGDEAMKRLLACKGKDPYSILGLRADSSDEEIKKYYRKQAVLVHPDKNQEPGAEEAFKILGHAFEMIGDPSKRKQYDSHTQEELEADAMREFADMLTKLQTKIQEAANIMRCDTCGGKHQRVPVDRPFYSARFCQTCNMHHQAKEIRLYEVREESRKRSRCHGDVWAESSMLGFYWHYYALMEGHVFDITEWMKCHRECFKHMKANAHGVMYRIATDGNRKNKHHQPNDANLEDFINRLFNKSGATGAGDHPAWSRPASSDQAWTTPGSGTAGASSSSTGKRSGRRKKRR